MGKNVGNFLQTIYHKFNITWHSERYQEGSRQEGTTTNNKRDLGKRFKTLVNYRLKFLGFIFL